MYILPIKHVNTCKLRICFYCILAVFGGNTSNLKLIEILRSYKINKQLFQYGSPLLSTQGYTAQKLNSM